MGFKPGPGTPAAMARQIESDMRLFTTVIRERNDALIFTLLGLIAALVAALMMVIYVRVARSLIKLEQGAAIVGKGNLDFKVGSTANDEIGALARTFDLMTEQLRASRATLETRIKERTAELRCVGRRSNPGLCESVGGTRRGGHGSTERGQHLGHLDH